MDNTLTRALRPLPANSYSPKITLVSTPNERSFTGSPTPKQRNSPPISVVANGFNASALNQAIYWARKK